MPADPVVAQDVTVTEALSFMDEAFRNIDLPAIGDVEFRDIVNALSSFARHRTPAPAGDVRVDEAQVGGIAAAIYAEVAIEPLGDLSQRRDQVQTQWFDAVRSALTTHLTTPDSSAVSGSAEGLREGSSSAENVADAVHAELWRADAELKRLRDACRDIAEAEAIPNDAVAFVWCRDVARAALTEGQQS